MIHSRVSCNPDNEIAEIHLSITAESLATFTQLIDRALNCWDSAPKELKDLGDMLTHGHITQDHTYKRINTNQSGDYYTAQEQAVIKAFIEERGFDEWLGLIKENKSHTVFSPDNSSSNNTAESKE